jgi:hypothetical protein
MGYQPRSLSLKTLAQQFLSLLGTLAALHVKATAVWVVDVS